MTRVFLYEFVTGGGWWTVDAENPPSGSLLNEAVAMIQALADDFAHLPGVEISILADARLTLELPRAANGYRVNGTNEERARFCSLASEADYVLILAPEFDGHLSTRVYWAEDLHCRLLSPHREFVAIASDKQVTAELLSHAGVSVPPGVLYSAGMEIPTWFKWPAVLKPCDGAGSMDVRLLHSPNELAACGQFSRRMRLEQYCFGTPASIAMLCGHRGFQLLPAGRQILANGLQYVGSEFPLHRNLRVRSAKLVRSAAAALHPTIGYVGFDLVLGDRSDGSDDFVIEVNPRLTTSYVGLRQICRQNLAGAMLALARGEAVELSFDERPVRFEVGRLNQRTKGT